MFSTRFLLAIQLLSRAGLRGVGAMTVRHLYEGPRTVYYLLSDEEAAGVLRAEYEGLRRQPYYASRLLPFTEEVLARAFALADELLAQHVAQGIACIGCDAKEGYPARLANYYYKPLVLFAKGNVALLHEKKILLLRGVDTPETKRALPALAAAEVPHFGSHVSGLTLGTSALAHRAWLDAGGQSIAVFGGGLAPSIPKGTVALAHEILDKSGCWMSAYPLGTPVQGEQVRLGRELQSRLASHIQDVDSWVYFRNGGD